MDAETRREAILQTLRDQQTPISAASLASEFGVSRQVVVGDIALLRARGNDIIATARGYRMMQAASGGRYLGKLACNHSFADTERELATIVELGGEVLDVIVEHELYGELTGQLNIATLPDVESFVEKLRNNETRLLLELTGGVHLHTVACRDAAAFEAIAQALQAANLLYCK